MSQAGWFERLSRPAAVLAAAGICKAYRGVPVLFPVDVLLESGQGLAVLGPNGSGKTTLLRLLAGVERPSEGLPSPNQTMPGPGRVGFAGHDTYLYEDMTGFENLKFSARLAGLAVTDLGLLALLESVGLRSVARERVRGYSAGMKRRTALSRILLLQPEVLLLDEPHASLDADGHDLVDSIVADACATGRIVVIASHDRERVVSLCTHVLELDAGRTTFSGSRGEWNDLSKIRLVESLGQ